MHDPRIGRFFAIDPLSSKYPHYTPYSFSGNRVIDAYELEGLEPVIDANGKITRYKVKKNQGPSQIAKDLNENYSGYFVGMVAYTDIVDMNYATYKANSNVKNLDDIDDAGYNKMNINPGDELDICLQSCDAPSSESEVTERRDPGIRPFAVPTLSIGAGAGLFGVGYSYTSLIMHVPKLSRSTLYYEAGRQLVWDSYGSQYGLPGADWHMGTGYTNVHSGSGISLTEILNAGPVRQRELGFGFGGLLKGIEINSQNADINLGASGVSSPGPVGSYSTSKVANWYLAVPMTGNDSLKREAEIDSILEMETRKK